IECPLGTFREADDDEAESVLPALFVLLDEPAALERREQPRGRRLVEAEPSSELGDAGFTLGLAQGEEQSRRPVDRADRVPVEDHRFVVPRAAGWGRWVAWPGEPGDAAGVSRR